MNENIGLAILILSFPITATLAASVANTIMLYRICKKFGIYT